MYTRDVASSITGLLKGFPIVTITGPRQSGKTTLAKTIFKNKPYMSLEDPDIRRMSIEDPRGFLSQFPDGAILDEVQRAPELFSYLQTHVDSDGRMGLFLLTGSQQFGLISRVTQSLAGRTAFVELMPFSIRELERHGLMPSQVDQMLFMGGYPALYSRDISPREWFPSYVAAYVERDVRQVLNVQDLESFQRFVRLCAGRCSQIMNLSSLANDCGITHNTAKAWISVLEASYILFRLRPYHANFNKRLVKSPKLYFYDAGLLCWLLGIYEKEQLITHPLRGAIFETFIVSELMKAELNKGKRPAFYFWRDSNGNEIDIVAEFGTKVMPIEIKAGQTLNSDFFTGLLRWMEIAGMKAARPTLIYGGAAKSVYKGISVFGWNMAGEILA